MPRKISKRNQKQAKDKQSTTRGRPASKPEDLKIRSLRFRVTSLEADLIDLAALLAGRRNRSIYARDRLLYFARMIAKSHNVDISTPFAVRKALHIARKRADDK